MGIAAYKQKDTLRSSQSEAQQKRDRKEKGFIVLEKH